MLFYLTDSLIVDNHDQRFDDICTAIYHLAVQSAEGNHVVIGDIDVISHYRNIFKNDYCVGSLFNKLYQNITFEVVPSFINYYVEVVLTNPSTRVDQDGRTVVQLEYSSLTPLEASNKTSLVCEFLSDAKFYGYILRWFINKLGVNVHYAFHKVDGVERIHILISSTNWTVIISHSLFWTLIVGIQMLQLTQMALMENV